MYKALGPLPMTPDKTILWAAYDIPELDSKLYASPAFDCVMGNVAIQAMINMAQRGPEGEPQTRKIDSGSNGAVYRVNGVAIKQAFSERPLDEANGLGGTQALVTLHEGLIRLGRPRFKAVTPYACIVAGHNAPEGLKTTMMMSYVEGEKPHPGMFGLPDCKKRREVYDKAISLCGAESNDIHYDDVPANLKVKTLWGIVHTITKLDIWASPSFVEKMTDNPPPTYSGYM